VLCYDSTHNSYNFNRMKGQYEDKRSTNVFSRFKDIVAKKSSKFRIIFIYLFFAFIAAKYVSQRRHRQRSYSRLRCKKVCVLVEKN